MGSLARTHNNGRVRSSLKAAGAQTVAELCENTGLSRDQVRRALDTLERRGDVGLPTKDGRSMRWSLAAGER